MKFAASTSPDALYFAARCPSKRSQDFIAATVNPLIEGLPVYFFDLKETAHILAAARGLDAALIP